MRMRVRIHTGVGHTDSESAQHFWLGKTLTHLSCSPDAGEVRTWISSPTLNQPSHPAFIYYHRGPSIHVLVLYFRKPFTLASSYPLHSMLTSPLLIPYPLAFGGVSWNIQDFVKIHEAQLRDWWLTDEFSRGSTQYQWTMKVQPRVQLICPPLSKVLSLSILLRVKGT